MVSFKERRTVLRCHLPKMQSVIPSNWKQTIFHYIHKRTWLKKMLKVLLYHHILLLEMYQHLVKVFLVLRTTKKIYHYNLKYYREVLATKLKKLLLGLYRSIKTNNKLVITVLIQDQDLRPLSQPHLDVTLFDLEVYS